MAWEQRGDHRYYYRAYKVDGRVRKAYLGSGLVADFAAHQDAQSQQVRRDAAERRRRENEAIDGPVDGFTDTLETLTRATLISAGYHRHHGSEWRKRRHA